MENKNEYSEKRFNNVLIKFLLDEPFFSTIVRHLKKVKTKQIPTAGVAFENDSMTLYWNPDFIESLTIKQIFGLLKHECYHLIFKHLTTRRQDPHVLWNIATDLAINSTIPFNELPEGGLVPGKPTIFSENIPKEIREKSMKMSNFIESLPPNKASEWYMEKLKNDDEINEICKELFQPQPGNPGKHGEDGEEGSKGSCAGFDHHFENNMSSSDKEIADAKVKKIVKEAVERADRCSSWGSASSEMKNKIRALLKDTIDWKKVLHYFCGTKQRANKTRTMRKINRKYPYIHSGKKIKHTSNLAIYIDQSGSVGDDDLIGFFGALSELSKNVTFTVYHFDTGVDDNNKYIWKKRSNHKKPLRTRSGGTCFNCVETHFRKIVGTYDGYIVMTDGCAPKPKTCISKRCWVLLPGTKLYFNADKRDTIVNMKNMSSAKPT